VLISRQARLQRILLVDPGYPDPFVQGTADTPVPSIVVLAPGIRMPYIVQYSVGIDRELRKGTTASINYVGGRGVALFRSRDINAPLPPDYTARPDAAFSRVRRSSRRDANRRTVCKSRCAAGCRGVSNDGAIHVRCGAQRYEWHQHPARQTVTT